VSRARELLPAALVALVAHVALYGSVAPADGEHAYLRWYEPAVAGLSVAAVVVWCGLVALGFAGRISSVRTSARRVAVSAGALLWLQESLERSISAHAPAAVTLAPSQWLTVIAVLAAASALLARAIDAGRRLAATLVPAERPRVVVRPLPAAAVSVVRRPLRPLASGSAMRAPPLLAV
jgi:hypothetical protein